jgi:hypothetical protein
MGKHITCKHKNDLNHVVSGISALPRAVDELDINNISVDREAVSGSCIS